MEKFRGEQKNVTIFPDGYARLLILAKTAGEIAVRFYRVLPGYSVVF